MQAPLRRAAVVVVCLSVFSVAATIVRSHAAQKSAAPQAVPSDKQPPFDKPELFAFFAAGPIPSYARHVISQRGCTFAPDAHFLASFPIPAVQEVLKNIKPSAEKRSSSNRDAAYELLPRALDATHQRQFAVSDEIYQKALKLAPDSATLHLAYATNFLLTPDGMNAEREARRSLELWPDNAEAHGVLSLAFMAQRNVAGAIAEARETLLIFPQHTSAKFQLGVALAQNHQYEEAIPALRSALLVLPNVPSLRKFLGISLLQTEQIDDAIAQLTWYVRADAADPEGHYFLGTALRTAGRQTEADLEFQRAENLKSPSRQ
jgi:Flp pilus assembly protein TadD